MVIDRKDWLCADRIDLEIDSRRKIATWVVDQGRERSRFREQAWKASASCRWMERSTWWIVAGDGDRSEKKQRGLQCEYEEGSYHVEYEEYEYEEYERSIRERVNEERRIRESAPDRRDE